MGENPRLIFRPDENTGKLVMSFTGVALDGAQFINADNPSPAALLRQIERLSSPTGIIEVEFPGEPNVRNIAVDHMRPDIAA